MVIFGYTGFFFKGSYFLISFFFLTCNYVLDELISLEVVIGLLLSSYSATGVLGTFDELVFPKLTFPYSSIIIESCVPSL